MTAIPRNLGMATITRPTPDKEVRALHKSFDVASAGRLFISVPGADLDLSGGKSDKVEIEVYVRSQSKNEALALTDRVKLRMRAVDKQTIRVESKSFYQNAFIGWNTEDALQMRLVIRLPSSFNVDIQSAGGRVSLNTIDGRMTVQLSGGALTSKDMKGRMEVSGFGSSVDIDGFDGSTLSLTAGASDLSVRRVKAREIIVRASGSNADLAGLEGQSSLAFHSGSAEVKDLSGPLEAQVQGCSVSFHLDEVENSHFEVSGGELGLHIKPQLKARLLLEGAELFLDKSLAFAGDEEEDRIEGRLNKGKNLLHARAAAGIIRCVPA